MPFPSPKRCTLGLGTLVLVLSSAACSDQPPALVAPEAVPPVSLDLSGIPSSVVTPLTLTSTAPSRSFTSPSGLTTFVGQYTATGGGTIGSFLVYCINFANGINVGETWNVRTLTFDEAIQPANLAAVQRTLGAGITAGDILFKLRQSAYLADQFGPTLTPDWDEIQFGTWKLFQLSPTQITQLVPTTPAREAELVADAAAFAGSSASTATWRLMVDARAWDPNVAASSLRQTMITRTQPAALGDFVWHDLNANGVQDAGEPGIPGATVTATGPNGPLPPAVTDAAGRYEFTNLARGTYTVCAALPAGFTDISPAGQGGDPAKDSDGTGATNCASVTLALGETNLTIDFGFFQRAALGDFVWYDQNGNGVQDAGEAGIPDATVTLDGPGGPQSTTTDANGAYGFANLLPGTYTVCVAATPAGFAGPSPTTQGGNPATDSNGLGGIPNCAAPVTLQSGDTDNTIDFGYLPLGSIGDRVWNDLNGDGVQDAGEAGLSGWTVTITGPVNASTTTGANGLYDFPNLPAGVYTACVTPVSGFAQTYDLDGLQTANCAEVMLGLGQNRDDVDFGYRVPPVVKTGTIGNYTWIDANGNGRQDAGEPFLNGVTLTLGGTATGTQVTAGGGLYLFTGLGAGNYTVQATAPAGFTFTTPNAFGTNTGNDSNVSPSMVTLATDDSNDLTIDFGFVALAGGGQGCTPGYWRQPHHFDSWKWYSPTDMLDAVFGVTFRSTAKNNPKGPLTLRDAVQLNGNGNGEQLFRHGTAALLNAVYQSGVSYQYTAAQVITMVRSAWLSGNATTISNTHKMLATANERGCPLN